MLNWTYWAIMSTSGGTVYRDLFGCCVLLLVKGLDTLVEYLMTLLCMLYIYQCVKCCFAFLFSGG